MVILLCCLMMGWASRNLWHSATAAIVPSEPPADVLAAQAATLPAEVKMNEAKANAAAAQQAPAPATAQAAFERLHISHARINVPQ
jgi:hypothetical protein